MKSNISQLLDSVVQENEEYVREEEVTFAEYILNQSESEDNGWLFYLTDEEIEEFENDEDKADEYIREIKEYVNWHYAYSASIKIKEEDLRDILKKELENARNFSWIGWRIPIYTENNGELSSGSWLSQGSWQPDAIEVHSLHSWNMGDLGHLDENGEEDYDEDDLEEEIENSIDFVVDNFEVTAKSRTNREIELV